MRHRHVARVSGSAGALAALLIGGAASGQSFVNWESPHVSPLALTPDGERLLAVNTADGRLEVFETGAGVLAHVGSVPVGLDPVSVRARTDTEAWVVNHVSDSISVVDLTTLAVRATIPTGDEPADVVFAGEPARAFVTVSQLNEVRVYDPADLAAPPVVLEIAGEDPRALATDGTHVYAAIFESGNDTTILDEFTVSSGDNPYPGRPNPPPNAGDEFAPPINPELPLPPHAGLIVKKDAEGAWRDDNDADWSAAVGWDLHGHDVAVIDAQSLAVSYVRGTMNINMSLGARPGGGALLVGTEATNEVRFEPNLNGRFVRVMGAVIVPPAETPATLVDLNPHLDYTGPSVGQELRDQSLGDPRGVVWSAAGDRAYVSGMGSNNVVVLDGALARAGRVEVGQGPTGVALHEGERRLYVLNKFDASVSIVDVDGLTETGRVAFHDATPAAVRAGRPHLYDTHRTSGLGQASCASCHVDARMDQVSWDLGDPLGEMKNFNQTCNFGQGGCEDWHPMKGPMATQTLVSIMDTGPLHWRADREDLRAFNGAFESLLGDDTGLTDDEMDEFVAFVATLRTPPNPNRGLDNSLPDLLDGGDAVKGEDLFLHGNLDVIECVDCHALPSGTNGQLTSAELLQESQSFKIPQLRNMHEKTGFDQSSAENNRGFGYVHDGNVDTLFEFLQFRGFRFRNDQERRDVVAFMMSFSTETHAGVGAQATVGGVGPDQSVRRNELVALALTQPVGFIVKGTWDGEQRGAYHVGAVQFQTDRDGEMLTLPELDALAADGAAITYTLVPAGTDERLGVDRDGDGHYDRDELDACSDPADPDRVPGKGGCDCPADLDGDGVVGFTDLVRVLAAWGPCADCPEDLDASGDVEFADLLIVLAAWGACG